MPSARPAGPPLSGMLLPCPLCPLPGAICCWPMPPMALPVHTLWLSCPCSHHGPLLSSHGKSWSQSPAYLKARGAQGVRPPLPKPERVRVSLCGRSPPQGRVTQDGAGPPTGPTSLGCQLLGSRGPRPASQAFPWALSATRVSQTWPPSPVSTLIGAWPRLHRLPLGGAPQPGAPGGESESPGLQSSLLQVPGQSETEPEEEGAPGASERGTRCQHAGRGGWWPRTAHAPPRATGPARSRGSDRPPQVLPHQQWGLEGPWASRSPTHSPGGRSCGQTQDLAPGTGLA